MKAGYKHRNETDSNYLKMKRAFKKLCRKHKMKIEIVRESFLIRKAESDSFWKILISKKILSKESGITISTRESYFQGLIKAESEILVKLLDKQTLGNHDYCISNWNSTDHLSALITLEKILTKLQS